MTYDKQAREIQPSKREEEGKGIAAWLNLFSDLKKVSETIKKGYNDISK